MDARRTRFAAALILFVLWVAALAVMAVQTGRRPPVAEAPAPGNAADAR